MDIYQQDKMSDTECTAKPIPLDSPVCEAIHDLRRLGYSFDQILEQTGVQLDFLKAIYLGLNINYNNKPKRDLVLTATSMINHSNNNSSTPALSSTPTFRFTPTPQPQIQTTSQRIFANNKWLSNLVIDISDDESDDENENTNGSLSYDMNSQEGQSDYLSSQMKHLKTQLALLEKAKLDKLKKEKIVNTSGDDYSNSLKFSEPLSNKETTPVPFEASKSDIDELRRLNSLLESIQITLLTPPVQSQPNSNSSEFETKKIEASTKEYNLSTKLNEIYQQQIRLIKTKILKEKHAHDSKYYLGNGVPSSSPPPPPSSFKKPDHKNPEEEYLARNELIYPPTSINGETDYSNEDSMEVDVDDKPLPSDEIIQLVESDDEINDSQEASEENKDEESSTESKFERETLTNKEYIDNVENLKANNSTIYNDILIARPKAELFIPYESTIKKYRFSRINPDFSFELLKSLSYSNKIDENRPFCLNEINGCTKETNPYCEYQHFSTDESYMNETEIIMDLIKNFSNYVSINIPKSESLDPQVKKSIVSEIKQRVLKNPGFSFKQFYQLILDYRLEVIERFQSL